MNLSILLPFIIVASLALVAFLIYRSPLDLQIALEWTGAGTLLLLSARWSALSLKSTFRGGEGSLSLFFLGKRMFRRELAQNPEIRKSPERGTAARTGPDLLLQTLPLVPDMIRILKAIFRHLTIRQIDGDFTIGLPNPADTGMLFGGYSAIRPLLLPCHRISLSMKPVFDREILEGHLVADVRLSRPLCIPVLLLRLAVKPRTRSLIRRFASHTAGIAG